MAKYTILLAICCLAFAGCSGGAEDEFSDKAPPAGSDAQGVTPPANKPRIGADGPQQAGGGQKAMERPAGS